MTIPTKKLKNGFEIPVLGVGTWKMGGKRERDAHNNDEENIAALKRSIELGATHIDTAEAYAAGHAEELVGQAIKDVDRSTLFLVSKVAQSHMKYTDVLATCHHSLDRLQTLYLDLYLVHGPSMEVPIRETMRAMDELVAQGKVKYIGLSNFTAKQFIEAQAASSHKVVVNQLHYNLEYREPEDKGIITYCQENDVMVVAWRPIQKGMLSQNKNPLIDRLCKKYNKTPTQIALNWLISQENIVAITKMSSCEHIEENLGSVGWTMESEDIEIVRKEYPDQKVVSDTVPLLS